MSNCVICGNEHTLMYGNDPQMYCSTCKRIRSLSEGTLTHVIDNLYLGDYLAAKDFSGERLCVYCNPPDYGLPHRHIPILSTRPKSPTDRTAIASIHKIEEACEYIDKKLLNGDKLIVHCMGGVERSPLTVAYYLVCINEQSTLEMAYKFLKSIRPVVADRTSWLPKLADGRLVENHTLSDTNAFPGRLRALPDLPSK